MQSFTSDPIRPARIDWQADTPFALDYGDSYFMPGRGPEESRAVFIDASGLPERFSALPGDGLFVIGEIGFGTGLNLLLAAESFLSHAPPGARLHLYSAELHPLLRDDLARAVGQWHALSQLAGRLLDGWPEPAPGFHRFALNRRIQLTLMLGDAEAMWRLADASVDAWFLDGFAPARNPAAWSDELFGVLAERSRPGASVATFTAAGDVRRGLAASGFEVQRQEGFGGKRHRLVGRRRGRTVAQVARSGRAVVVGAGFAGCTTARALAERGWAVTVCDPNIGKVPKALTAVLYTSASHHLTAQNRFYLSAFLRARRWLSELGFPQDTREGYLDDVVQHLVDKRIKIKTRRAMETGAWPPELLADAADGAARFHGGGCLNVWRWCARLLDHPAIETRAERIDWNPGSGASIAADATILCTAGDTREFPTLSWLPLRVVRGQVTFCRATIESRAWRETHCHAGYVTPAVDDLHCIGATFDRRSETAEVDAADDERNLAELKRHLPDRWRALGGTGIQTVGHHAGVRCQAADMLPLVGPVPDASRIPHELDGRTWLNIAYGSKGLTHTPLTADLLADRLSGLPSPVDAGVSHALAPERFVERRRRREPDWRPTH